MLFKRETLAGTENTDTEGNITKEIVDEKIEKWHKKVQEAMQSTIPIKRKITLMKEISPLIKQVQFYNKNLDKNKYRRMGQE